jgi:2-polyprenyl-3-methyl-5-hydroxy-6-metoxy-1,4-benzoquinol methylase
MKCILCRSSKFKTLFFGKNWQVVRCSKCSLARTLRGKNPDYAFYHRDLDYVEREHLFRNIFQKRYNIIKKFFSVPGKVLEIGCSTGILLSIFAENSWQVLGVEPSKSAEIARSKGIKVLKSTFEKVELPKDHFDLVILNHTLEHLDNPVSVMRKINKILKKGGIVFVDVPNFGGISARILGKNWPFLSPDEHNFHFSYPTLRKLVSKSGFTVIHHESRSGIFELANPVLDLWQSLTGFKKRFFADILGFPGALVATMLNRGASISILGRK